MRRSMVSMLGALAALSTPLGAQEVDSLGGETRTAVGFGFTSTLGSGWQIEAGEVAFVWRTGWGPIRALSAGVRLGAFVDQGVIIGGARGFVAAGGIGLRSGSLVIAELGDDLTTTQLGLDATVEATGFLTANSPLAVGPRWVAVSFLPGFRAFRPTGGVEYSLVFGPTVFIGTTTDVRAFLAFRVEVPLARREPHP